MEESSTRQSSKLSLGSSPSILSGEDQLELDGPLTPIEAMDDDEDDLSALNSILQTGSPGSLSNEETATMKMSSEREDDSASSLSSALDDFPLSRSASPVAEEEKEQVTRKRRNEETEKNEKEEENMPVKKIKKEEPENNPLSSIGDNNDMGNKKRKRYEPDTKTRRRQGRQKEEENGESSQKEEDEDHVKEPRKTRKTEEKDQEEEEDDDEKEEEKDDEKENGKEEEKEKNENEITENDEDYQQRHKEALDALTHIEVEFARLRDRMYQEKMSELNEEAIMIANGTHPELISLMAEIEEKKGKRINSAEAWRRHQYANFKRQYEGFEYQANIHFISQKNALRRNLLSSIHDKKWSIENERKKLNDLSMNKPQHDERELIIQKREQRDETNELIDIKETIGFPMAPNPTGLNAQDIDEDLRIMGIHPT
ncbi:unnamed protein product [Rhizopus microsporus]